MSRRASFRSRNSPKKAGWWGPLLATLLFAFYVHYIPAHLATESHYTDSLVADADLNHDNHHRDHHHHHDSDHSKPHQTSDHTLTFTAATKAPRASALVISFLPVTTPAAVTTPEPELQLVVPVFERIRPPGESPPDPLQPRAPPLA